MCIGLFFCIYRCNFMSAIFVTFSSWSLFMTLKYYNIICNNIYFGLYVLFNHFPLFAFLLFIVFVCHAYSVAQSYVTLFNPVGLRSPGSSVHGIFQTKILDWVAVSNAGVFLNPALNPCLPHWKASFFLIEPLGKPICLSCACLKKSP